MLLTPKSSLVNQTEEEDLKSLTYALVRHEANLTISYVAIAVQ